MTDYSSARIMVVDDEEPIKLLLTRILNGAGYADVVTASSSDEAEVLLAETPIDLMLTDMQMPGGSGIDLLSRVHATMPGLATLMVTGTDDPKLADRALGLGAYGYIVKPFRQSEVVIGVSNALRRRHLELENRHHRDHLEEMVKSRTEDLWDTIIKLELSEKDVRASRSETIDRLAVAGEFHDEETGAHVIRMSRCCEILAREAGEEVLSKSIREAASLHDVGKIGVPDGILLKPGPLLPDERKRMEEHAELGHGILKGSQSPLLQLAAQIALVHHERVDGTGYPAGLKGTAIPIAGRIAAIADVFDALTSNRVYRAAFPLGEAVDMMKAESGTHFDAELLTLFWGVLPEILGVQHRFRSTRSITDAFTSERVPGPPVEAIPAPSPA